MIESMELAHQGEGAAVVPCGAQGVKEGRP